jgi:hypothetical protein
MHQCIRKAMEICVGIGKIITSLLYCRIHILSFVSMYIDLRKHIKSDPA